MAEVIVTEFMDPDGVARLGRHFRVHYDSGLVDKPGELAELLPDARALVVRNRTRVTAALLDAGPRLLCIGRLGVGLDNIDLDACAARGLPVYPATGANVVSVAEYAVTMALVLLRDGAYGAGEAVMDGHWPRERLVGREAAAKVFGVVGFGAIGRAAAERAAAMGMRVLAHDPHVPGCDPAWALAARRDLAALLAEADAVSLHVPLTPETRHLIGPDRIAAMKPGAVLINTARGGVVDEAALVEALRAGRLGGAALDVFETEPLNAAAGARFRGLANLILTPHIAGVTRECNARIGEIVADRVIAHLEGA
ncbi:MAG TPA: hydroxyacid dehydrogenase [Thermohalobaculum sp.]|nr:hydroxyacid dehydrogenase [Thermohalobaculum sp.]